MVAFPSQQIGVFNIGVPLVFGEGKRAIPILFPDIIHSITFPDIDLTTMQQFKNFSRIRTIWIDFRPPVSAVHNQFGISFNNFANIIVSQDVTNTAGFQGFIPVDVLSPLKFRPAVNAIVGSAFDIQVILYNFRINPVQWSPT